MFEFLVYSLISEHAQKTVRRYLIQSSIDETEQDETVFLGIDNVICATRKV